MFENESGDIVVFKAKELLPHQVVEIIGQEERGEFILHQKLGNAITLQCVENIGFSFPRWEKQERFETVSSDAFVQGVNSLEPEDE